jgi:RNA polymerase sigma-70 factor (ECF subfamily)
MSIVAQGIAQNEDKSDIAAFLAGEAGALDRLVMRHKDRIFNLCFRLLGDYSDAEECAQEIFVKVFRSLKTFRLESSFSTWVYTIAVNTCKNRRNSAEFRFWKRVLRFGQDSQEEENGPDLEFEDPSASPLDLISEKEQETLLQAAINSLSYDHRTVIVLRHIEDLSYEEICGITGYNLGTLKSKLARARMELQKKLQRAYKGNADGMLSD